MRLSRLEGTRRLRVSETSTLGPTPLKEHPLKMGRYLVELEAPGRTPVLYPVWIQRLRHWRGVPPGASEPEPVRLPALEEIDDNEVVVPAGWFTCGSDPEAASALTKKDIWVGTFVLRRFPVTNREYLIYLNDLIDQGDEGEALRNVPRELALGRDQKGAALYGRDERGHFFLQEDADGDLWQPDWPVTMVSLTQGECYAAWMARRSGLPGGSLRRSSGRRLRSEPTPAAFPGGTASTPLGATWERAAGRTPYSRTSAASPEIAAPTVCETSPETVEMPATALPRPCRSAGTLVSVLRRRPMEATSCVVALGGLSRITPELAPAAKPDPDPATPTPDSACCALSTLAPPLPSPTKPSPRILLQGARTAVPRNLRP